MGVRISLLPPNNLGENMKTLFLVGLCLMSTGCASSGDLAKLQDEQTALKIKVDSLTVTNKQCDKKLDNFFKTVQQK